MLNHLKVLYFKHVANDYLSNLENKYAQMKIKFEISDNKENQLELFVFNSPDYILTEINASVDTQSRRMKTNNYNLSDQPGLHKMLVSSSFKKDLENLQSTNFLNHFKIKKYYFLNKGDLKCLIQFKTQYQKQNVKLAHRNESI
jgi:hypothetical protein